MIPNNHSSNGKDGFTILNYSEQLETNPKDKSKKICPICGKSNLGISKDGLKYQCFNGCDSKKIAFFLMEKAGHLKQQSHLNHNNYNTKIESSTKNKDQELKAQNKPLKITHQQQINEFIRDKYDDQIAYNSRTDEVEINGQPIDLDCLRPMIADKHGIDISNDSLARTFLYLANKNKYDPVKDYLERCKWEESLDIDKTISKLILSDNELYITCIRKFLIGAVARVYEPGCKLDVSLILQGKQGYSKSTFLRTISNGFFSDSMTGKLDTNDLRVMNENWFIEWSELDIFTAKDYHSLIKPFLSRQVDVYRLPYARKMLKSPRKSVITGTTNRDDFLKDPTGERRFWIVPISQPLDINFVEKVRDSLWSSILSVYNFGEDWNLPPKLWEAQAEENENYRVVDPWEEILLPYLRNWKDSSVNMTDLFNQLENKGLSVNRSKSEQMRIGDILKREGWDKKRLRVNGNRVYEWSRQ